MMCVVMRIASNDPHPYLLNRSGGICRIKEFSLINGHLHIVSEDGKAMHGDYHLIYRCPEHALKDIKITVSTDGTNWTIIDPGDEQYLEQDVCYPPPPVAS